MLTSGLSVDSQEGATLLYGFSCCLKSPHGENIKGCQHLKPMSYSHIKLRFKTRERFCFLLSHFSLSPPQRCSRSLLYPNFLNGLLAFCHTFSCDTHLAAGPLLLFLAQQHQGSELLHSRSMPREGGQKHPETSTCRNFRSRLKAVKTSRNRQLKV